MNYRETISNKALLKAGNDLSARCLREPPLRKLGEYVSEILEYMPARFKMILSACASKPELHEMRRDRAGRGSEPSH